MTDVPRLPRWPQGTVARPGGRVSGDIRAGAMRGLSVMSVVHVTTARLHGREVTRVTTPGVAAAH